MDKIGWTYLNFRKHIVFRNINNDIHMMYGSIPANIESHIAFVRHFVNNGKDICTFKEFKEFIKFDGRSAKAYDYGIIKVNTSLFRTLFHYLDNALELEKATFKMIDDLYDLKRENQRLTEIVNRDKTEPERILDGLKMVVEFLKK